MSPHLLQAALAVHFKTPARTAVATTITQYTSSTLFFILVSMQKRYPRCAMREASTHQLQRGDMGLKFLSIPLDCC